ncbi:hypothetical protein JD276_03635 [Leucobacter sp. CSA1]|uniref:Adhesin domain-containing protein n=1 Tax=Leucobacter chromiisoli TaxID=2796471 RepID=A0A934Q5R6_9MICO|nr:hypothetical protein [Leucobacter chromiisoli]MBK0418121.1 hypothetical protein [Leucobacter chromiisoli]
MNTNQLPPETRTSPDPESTPAGPERVGSAAPRRSAATPIVIATAVIGGVALLGAAGSSALGVAGGLVRASGGSGAVQTVDASGATGLDIDASATSFRLEFGDVAEATLEQAEGAERGRWSLERRGDEIVVERRSGIFGDWCFGFCFESERTTVLTLPEELDGALDVEIGVGAGTVDASGEFVGLDVHIGAGEVIVAGAARTLNVEVGAGTADFELDDVVEADFEVSAGEARASFTGEAPERVGIDVSVGSVDLALPDVPYDLRSRSSLGDVTNLLETSSASDHRIDADVSVGDITLRALR